MAALEAEKFLAESEGAEDAAAPAKTDEQASTNTQDGKPNM